jgi:hypothetical protein
MGIMLVVVARREAHMNFVRKALAVMAFLVSVVSLTRRDWLGFAAFALWGAVMLINPRGSRRSLRLREAMLIVVVALTFIRLYLSS